MIVRRKFVNREREFFLYDVFELAALFEMGTNFE